MIRNVVLGKLRDDLGDDERAAVEKAIDGILGFQLPGQLAMSGGADLQLREGGWSFAIVNDWADVDAYRNYDLDAEHNGYRAVIGPACEQIGRVQFELP